MSGGAGGTVRRLKRTMKETRSSDASSSGLATEGSVEVDDVGGDGGPELPKKKRKRDIGGGRSTNAIKNIGTGERKRQAKEKANPGGGAR